MFRKQYEPIKVYVLRSGRTKEYPQDLPIFMRHSNLLLVEISPRGDVYLYDRDDEIKLTAEQFEKVKEIREKARIKK